MQDKIARIILDSCSDYIVLGEVAPQMWYRRAAAAIAQAYGQETARLQAQVAVMGEALDLVLEFLAVQENNLISLGEGLEHDIDVLTVKGMAALSDTKLLWSGKALLIGWDGDHKELVIERNGLAIIGGTDEIDKQAGQQGAVYVVANQETDEQEQVSIVEAFNELRDVVGGAFDGIDDVEAWVRKIRGGESEPDATDAQGQ